MVNYYEVLGVSVNATATDIKLAYKQLALKYHPDRNQGNQASEEIFKSVNEAYQILSHESRKGLYDQKLEYYQYSQRPQTFYASNKEALYQETESSTTSKNYYAEQGKYYQETNYVKKEKNTIFYFIGITLFLIMATGLLLLGMMMNHIAAHEKYKAAFNDYNNESYNKALREVNEALQFDNTYKDAYELRGDIKMRFQKYNAALQDYKMTLKYSEKPSEELLKKLKICKTRKTELSL